MGPALSLVRPGAEQPAVVRCGVTVLVSFSRNCWLRACFCFTFQMPALRSQQAGDSFRGDKQILEIP